MPRCLSAVFREVALRVAGVRGRNVQCDELRGACLPCGVTDVDLVDSGRGTSRADEKDEAREQAPENALQERLLILDWWGREG